MIFWLYLAALVLYLSHVSSAAAIPRQEDTSPYGQASRRQSYGKIAPKVMIINMFYDEAKVWYDNQPSMGIGSLFDKTIPVSGLSPLYPQVHCTGSGDVCQATLGESEINAAASMSALVLGADAAGRFDLTRTYFLISGIAGVNPKLGTLGSVALAKFAVQAALQYELDARDMPANFSTGYLAYGTDGPGRPPASFYGTEVMEVNEALRDAAFDLVYNNNSSNNSASPLADDAAAAAYRAKYNSNYNNNNNNDDDNDDENSSNNIYAAATAPPSVLRCDTVTSDNYYSGALLSEAFENTTRIWTNQSQVTYCMTAQEDSAVLQVLMRGHLARRADFSRAIIMRAGSNFDRPPPSMTAFAHLQSMGQNGHDLALLNTWRAGGAIVRGILDGWDRVYGAAGGVPPTNYVGDVLGSLGGTPNFGPGSVFGGRGAAPDGITYDAAAAAAAAGVEGGNSSRSRSRSRNGSSGRINSGVRLA